MSEQLLNRLRVWRLSRHLSLADVAGVSGISVGMLSKVERGKADLSPMTKVHLARSLGVPVSELFDPPTRLGVA